MDNYKAKIIEETLAKPDLHRQWAGMYRVPENDKFFKYTFDYITRIINAPKNSTILDAGCGFCTQSIRLANRGFFVKAVDFSEFALKKAVASVKVNGLENRISIQRENLLSLSFERETFNYILCWGVLMHIIDLERAISELTRVLKPRGILIIGENNTRSLQSIILRIKRWFFSINQTIVKKTPEGINFWINTCAGLLLTREANIKWLIKRFRKKGLIVKKHVSRQFTELYVETSSPLLKTLIHGFNNFWFKYVKIPYPAYGNIVIFQKEK